MKTSRPYWALFGKRWGNGMGDKLAKNKKEQVSRAFTGWPFFYYYLVLVYVSSYSFSLRPHIALQHLRFFYFNVF